MREHVRGVTERATLTTGDVARALGVDPRTIRWWLSTGRLIADMRLPGGAARFTPKTLDRVRDRMVSAA